MFQAPISIVRTSGSEASEMGDNNNITTLCSLALMSVGVAIGVCGGKQKARRALM